MAHESQKTPQVPGHPDHTQRDQGIDETRAPRRSADPDAPDTGAAGITERLKAQKEGRHVEAKTPDGKPYADSQDPDGRNKHRANTGGSQSF